MSRRFRAKLPAPTITGSPVGQGNQTYLDARAEWNERYGSYIAQARAWRYAALLSMCVAGVSVAGLAYVGAQTHLVPFVVEVNQLGDALAAKRADVAATPDTRLIRAQLARWIDDVRTVYMDVAAERTVITEAYGMVDRSSPAFEALNKHFRTQDPFNRAKDETVIVHVSSVLPISQNTWRIEWSEEARARDGSVGTVSNWRGTITVMIHPPSDSNTILVNPTGLYLQDFSWSKAQ
ncbi:MAG: conjugal transfer protein TrbF [Acetobacteraceae bacterium]|nr:conjugal transfer protein TrbF [Acetobacteraceae bacterium]